MDVAMGGGEIPTFKLQISQRKLGFGGATPDENLDLCLQTMGLLRKHRLHPLGRWASEASTYIVGFRNWHVALRSGIEPAKPCIALHPRNV